VVVTPSHNPPDYGGFKYNPPHGGPADTDETSLIETRSQRTPGRRGSRGPAHLARAALRASTTREHDYLDPYVADLAGVVDFRRHPRERHPDRRGPHGRGRPCLLEPIATRYRLKPHGRQPAPGPTFAFMTVDHDGKVRMDCSSRTPWPA